MLRAVGGYGDRFPCHGACLWELKEAFVRREVSSSPGSVLCDPSPRRGVDPVLLAGKGHEGSMAAQGG